MNTQVKLLTSLAKGLPLFGLVLLLVVPGTAGPYLIHLLTLAMIFSIFALGYDLLFGHTGIVSFGHSIFYGMPAYVIGMLGTTMFNIANPFILLPAAIVSGIVLGAVVGWICSFSRGIYLAIVTFAVAQIVELVVLSDPGGVTFGENGIVGIRPSALNVGGMSVDLFSGIGLYYLTLGLLLASFVGLRWLARSQWGQVFHAIRENEERLLSLGYNPRPYKIIAFAISGGVAAIAGSMVAFLNNIVSPAMVDWQVGAEVLLITVLGGAGTPVGPILGAFVVVFTEAFATSLTGGGNWVYVLGGLYILVALFLPGGLMAKLPRLISFLQRPWAGSSSPRTSSAKGEL